MSLFNGKSKKDVEPAAEKPIEKSTEAEAVKEEISDGEEYLNDFSMRRRDFGPFLKYIENPDITDIDYNGRSLWTTDVNNNKHEEKDDEVNDYFIRQFAVRVSNAVSDEFNQKSPVLEAETRDLRISIIHDSRAISGMSVCIRKTPPVFRISAKSAIETDYATKETLSLLANCVKAHMNIVVAGAPRAGKTELCKFLSHYIPDEERVITIENVLEWRYRALKPNADCIEIKCDDEFTYTDAIIASLKQNPQWIMIAETRGEEVAHLINGFTTGVNGMTTLHTDDVRKIPQRMINMINDSVNEDRILSNIYEFVDVGVLVSIRTDRNGNKRRIIDQVGFFTNDGKKCVLVVDDGKVLDHEFPEKIKERFLHGAVESYFENDTVNSELA